MSLAQLGDWVQERRVTFGQLFAVAYLVFARPTVASIAAGTLLLVGGAAVRTWASGHIRKREMLAVTGPYAHTRNPLYFGSFLMALGALVMGWNPWVAAAALIFALPVYHMVIRQEEILLAGKFGEEFAAYTRAVPRFLPRLQVPLGTRGAFDWELVRRHGEWRVWLVAAALPLLFAVLLSGQYLPLSALLGRQILSR